MVNQSTKFVFYFWQRGWVIRFGCFIMILPNVSILREFHKLTHGCFGEEIRFDACPLGLCRKYFWTRGKIRNSVCVSFPLLYVKSFRSQEFYQRFTSSGFRLIVAERNWFCIRRTIEWSLLACEQCIYFCEHEQGSNFSCEQRALMKMRMAKSEHFVYFPLAANTLLLKVNSMSGNLGDILITRQSMQAK